MKIKILIVSTIAFLLFLFSSCNSTGYEIEEVEDYSDTTIVTARNEIKQEIEQPKVEIKTDVVVKKDVDNISTTTEPQIFTVQLGAFESEANAKAFVKEVSIILNINLSYKLINGMFKVRTGEFTSKDAAAVLLSKINESGFKGFITDSSK